jgi:prepilin-type N-terminal cleavage/methylation domain-containing protein
MRGYKVRQQHGFTLLEVLFTLVASVMLVGGVFLFYLMSLRSWEEGSRNVALERNAGLIMDKIVRGTRGRFGIREADIGTVQVAEDGSSITYMVDKNDPPTAWNNDDVTTRFYQSGKLVMYDPDTSAYGDEVILNRFGDVDSVRFSLTGSMVNASLALSSDAVRTTSRRLTVQVQTNIFLRKRKR